MKICRSCREEFQDKVNKCLYCGGPLEIVSIPQQGPFDQPVVKRKSGIKPGEIWKHYKIAVIAIIILIAGILFAVSQKEEFKISELQVIGTEPLKIDAPVAPVREPALVTEPSSVSEPAPEQKSASLPAKVIYLYNNAVSLCPGTECTDPQKAVEYLNEAIRVKPDFANAYGARGNAYSNLKQYQPALEDYSKAIQLQNDNSIFFNNRGNVYKELDKYQQAIGDYNEAIRLKPEDPTAYHNRGNAYFIQGDQKTGCVDAQKACDMGNCKLLDFGKEKKYCQ
jgi:tetratricopeptide (TPR) repeat protein